MVVTLALMKSLLILGGIVLVLLVVSAVLKHLGVLSAPAAGGGKGKALEPSPFKRNKYFLSKGEAAFYPQLRLAIPSGTVLLAKVRLIDLLYLPPGAQNRQSWQNRVQSKHIDFVVCDARDLRPLLAIELDDKSHEREDRRERDGLVDHILQCAGLPFHREPAAATYSAERLRAAIGGKLGV